ncbi:cadherin-5 [Discoglossus pictus]
MKLWWLSLLLGISSRSVLCHKETSEQHHSERHRRIKREWQWNQIFVSEEHMGNLPYHVGKISSNKTKGNVKYALQGQDVNKIFKVNEDNGDILCFERLDREKKDLYELTALLVDKSTNKTLEPPSTFYIRVLDINDNAPEFMQKVFNGSVLEMSSAGTSVTQVTATDADDPTVGGNARITYRLIQGQEFFTIDNKGTIFTHVPNLDREQQATYELIIEAKDSPEQRGGLWSTASVIITLKDINDNFPTFKDKQYTFSVPENVKVGGVIGKMVVEDIDEPENRNTKYSFIKEKYQETFNVNTNAKTNEGILILKKPLDFESIKEYRMSIEATDPEIDLRVAKQSRPKSITEVIIKVLDVDEPPVFDKPFYQFSAMEDIPTNTIIGFVSAKDPDAANRKIGYSIRNFENHPFSITKQGSLINTKTLDRETNPWHNLTIVAEEIDPSNPPIKKESLARVFIKLLDVNDNAPEFAEPYQPRVCENAAHRTVIINISATDKDEMKPGMKFTYYSARTENNFTVQDNHDNTASVLVKYGQFNRDEAKVHYLPIVISDNGHPEQSSTNTLTITVCKCNEKGEFTYCEEAARQAAVSVPTIVIILISLFLILLVVIVVLILKRTQKKNPHILGKNVAEIHEQLVTYDEEGGGEMDTNSYDVSVLNSVRRNVSRPKPEMDPGPCLYAQVQKPSRNGDMSYVIEVKKDEADNDGEGLPYDTLHIFGYEGSESIVESLSSIESGSSDSDIDYDVLNDWGPRFKMLADLYGLEPIGEFAY